MIVYYCDDCGEEIEDKKDIAYISFYTPNDDKCFDKEMIMLCPYCFKLFKDKYLYDE